MKNRRITHDEIVHLYQENEKALDKLTENIVQLLDKSNRKIAVAESCTGGLLSKCITGVSGASKVYEIGLCTYSNRMKHQLLSVPESMLEQYGAVSEPTAAAMAQGLRTLSGADVCISVTGFAGPTGGTIENPVGTVYAGIICGSVQTTVRLPLYAMLHQEMNRETIRQAAAVCALSIAYQLLMEE